MKKQLLVVAALVAAVEPMKIIFCMEGKGNSKIDITSFTKEFSQKYQNINEITEVKILREGIFESTSAIIQTSGENNTEIKNQRKELYNQLTQVTGTKKATKESLFGIIDDISDEESDENDDNLLKGNNYLKFKQAKEKIGNNEKVERTFSFQLQTLENKQKQKTVQVNTLKEQWTKAEEELTVLNNQVVGQKDEIATIKQAIGILALKQFSEKDTMQERQKQLGTKIETINKSIIQLKNELSSMEDKEEITKKNLEIKAAEKKLNEYKNALEYLSKDLIEVEGKTGFFGKLRWNLGLKSYVPKNESSKINFNDSVNNNTTVVQINPTILVNVETNASENPTGNLANESNQTIHQVTEMVENKLGDEIKEEITTLFENKKSETNINDSFNDDLIMAQINPQNPSVIINIGKESQDSSILEIKKETPMTDEVNQEKIN